MNVQGSLAGQNPAYYRSVPALLERVVRACLDTTCVGHKALPPLPVVVVVVLKRTEKTGRLKKGSFVGVFFPFLVFVLISVRAWGICATFIISLSLDS